MTQDMNNSFAKALRAVVVATLTLLTGGNAMAEGEPTQPAQTGVHVMGNVYGGGNLAHVGGSVTVNIKAGTVEKDVYGGGALANTNTNNWNGSTLTVTYHEVTLPAGTSLVGYFSKSGSDYTAYTEGTATENTKYYKKTETIVNLTGGTIGNAYGGGLGQKNGVNGATSDIQALVYGDVLVNVNGTKFTQEFDTYQEGTEENATTVKVPKTGRVFGCNNLNGSPKKTVTVHVYKTVPLEGDNHQAGQYEIAAVYGGGNEAAYEPIITGPEPETDANHAHTNVIIDGCSLTSIKQVYGGGNAASTPSTQVTINGAYEIDEVFGGGNGNDKIKRTSGTDVSWLVNPGANVGFMAYDADSEDYDTPEERAAKAYGFGKALVNINGGNIHAVYGGSNAKGNVRQVAVAMLDQTSEEDCFTVDEAYGGGKAAEMDGRAELNLGCIPGVGKVYGGARAATVNNNVVLTITNGTYTDVFGGNNEEGTINGTITINIEETGCRPIKIEHLYGGGNLAPYTAPTNENGPTLNIKSFTSIDNIYGGGYGEGADVTGNVIVNINEVKGRWSQANSTVENNSYSETGATNLGVIGNVYGGGYGADVIGDVEVNIGTEEKIEFVTAVTNLTPDSEGKYTVEGANIAGSVYGGGYGAATTVTGNVVVNIGGQKTEGTTTTFTGGNIAIGGSVYGGSALGSVNATKDASNNNALGATEGATTSVTLKKGNIAGAVFGGGKGEEPASSNTGTEAKVFGNATVTLYGDVVAAGLYGGCDQYGKMFGNTVLDLLGGTVGASNAYANVFGGGLGKYTNVVGDVTVNIGKKTYTGSTSTTVWGNVYGGSARGNVNTGTAGNTTYTTTVNLYKGTVNGTVFGGGLGVAAVEGHGEEGDPDYVAPVAGIPAGVKGNVLVNLNGDENSTTDNKYGTSVVTGSIFGCNDTFGSPEGDVEVHIYRTVTLKNDGTVNNKPTLNTNIYEIQRVFGGGNKATYSASGKTAKVIIETCDVSINEVYGGGYGADVPDTQVEVKGAYEIGTVFGGGYGAGSSDPAAADYNPGANVNGSTDVILKGGVIHEVYGGSNTKGNIVVGSNVNVSDGQGCCDLKVDNIYGGGKNASMEGGTSIVLGCQPNTWIEDIYAGSREADVDGNVELTITSGKFKRVFGGNKTSGKLKGSIKVNIEETGNCGTPIIIGELYAGGNEADYSIYGYKDDGTPMTADELRTKLTTENPGKTAAEIETLFQAAKKTEPQLNVRAFTSIGAIYGGGYSAKMYADPTVSINVVKGSHYNDDALEAGSTPALAGITPATTLPYPAHAKGAIGAIGNVFGGGNLATVYGSTTVNIGTETTVGFKTEPIHLRTDAETPLTKNTETGLYDITVEGANITGNVYGGGRLADVGQYDMANDDVIVVGNTYVNIGAKKSGDDYIPVAEGTSKVLIAGNVFGGGEGEATESGDGAFKCAKAIVTGGTNIHIGNGTINGTVYGGGEVGRVEENSVVAIGIGAGGTTPASAPEIKGDVFGAGKGKKTHGYSALMRGNPTVIIEGDAKVRGSVYGGGEIASVGKYNVKKGDNDPVGAPADVLVGMPYSLANSGSGYCTVIVRGNAEIGPEDEMKMTKAGGPDDSGHVFGAGKGVLPYDGYGVTDDDWKTDPWRVSINNQKDIFNSTTYPTNYEKEYFKYIETLALATETNVTIGGNAFVKGSVYGGSMNGHVQHDTHVTIAGGQIGQGEGANGRYTDWNSTSLAECPHWDFDANSGAPYDPYAIYSKTVDGKVKYYYDEACTQYAEGGSSVAKDGHTYYGNVFGGGSGVIPYRPGLWHRGAGSVGGDTYVNITGGHILTSVYGGNEHTDVGTYEKDASGQPTTTPVANDARGRCTVNMTGGTVGVPRTDEQKLSHPVVGNLFGAGKGDQRIFFNTWTNVISTEVNISGDARVYGSVFGGGEDGHVIDDAETNIGNVTIKIGKDTNGDEITETANENGLIIGTTGTSYYDGNVFGGGRGFSGDAQTAGTVGGNVRLNINAGSVYGSVYGGGRLASVGTMFEFPTLTNGDPNPSYGNFKEDEGGNTYGYVTVNISGGEIGRDFSTLTTLPAGAEHSGNVFGGSMGRLDLLNGTRNSIWPKMAQVKKATINISGNNTLIRRSVYGGGELGTVRDDAIVTISGGTIRRDVYGGGYGSEDRTYTVFSVYEPKEGVTTPSNPTDYESHTYAFTPMQFAGCVGKSTTVNVSGGYIRKSVYGGGEMASVGIINCRAAELTSGDSKEGKVWFHDAASNKDYYYTNMVKHGDVNTEFALSWPYEFEYVPTFNGATHVNITGGRLGLKNGDTDTGFEDNGDVYGAGKGKAGEYETYLFCANVGSTDVKIAYTSTPTEYSGTDDLIAGAVYGGGEDGHVMGNTKLTISGGLIYHSVYGGGSGKGKISRRLLLSGKTYGSTNDADYVTRDAYSITAGKVFGNTEVNMTDGYVVRNIYGGGNMGSVGKGNYAGGADDYSTAGYGEKVANLWSNADFLNSGKCTVKITGGTIGYIASDPSESMYPDNSSASLPYGNVFGGCRGEAVPNITDSPRYYYCPEFFVGYANETEVTIEGDNTKILGSVYGGGMDGHIRRDASVIIKGGEIGLPFTDDNKTNVVKTSAPDNIQWLARGNVYGAGSGIGKYGDEFSTSAGSVTRFTKVDIQGGTINRNVYGGGSLASVGAPKIPADRTDNPTKAQTLNEVKISGGHIGGDYSYNESVHVYGGHVFGGSRGDASLDATKFSTSMFTSITIDANATPANSPVIYGSVFGGGEVGIVKGSVDVTLNGGTVNDDVYGGGALANTNTENPKNANGDLTSTSTYTTTVNLFGGLIKGDAYGGGLGQLGTNPIAAMVYGDVAVNLGKEDFSTATAFTTSYFTDTHAGVVKSGRVFGCNNLYGYPHGDVTVTVNKTVTGKDGAGTDLKRTTLEAKANNKVIKENNPENYESVTGYVTPTYEVAAVYGGGNLANYQAAAGKKASVIINSCDVSVQDVYGGGNAAEVPATEVLVNGAYEIGEVFGGGNGKDDYTLDGGTSWTTNPGANINGNTNTLLLGGLIHEAYGGSNEKGTITGNVAINTGEGQPEYCDGCPLDVEKLVGAGKNADVNGDLIVVLGCKPETKTPLVFGGADNANVNGNVELTITSGTFGKVFGGNNMGGIIKGHIVLNIEETGCNPIKIDELYLGGNEASYSIYGYYDSGTTNADGKKIYLPRTAATDEHAAIENPTTDATHSFPYAQPVLNVVSCTSIGKVFGGGYGVGGAMYADPTVNINMTPGAFANNTEKGVPAVMTAMNLSSDDNPDKLGIIGDVYGGGNAADVVGNPTVNIGTTAKVQNHMSYTAASGYVMSEEKDVKGAYIIGNVFGAGKGEATTFTCEKAMVGIDGDGVANPDGGTTVNIYKGTVLGNVYGGGEVGRVEKNTVVTIGTGDGVDASTETPTSAPEIRGSVFGGGKGLETHGYSALVRGNPTVTVQGNAKVRGNVYGGGQIASVARYSVAKTDDEGAPYGVKKDEPYALKTNTSGFCTVTIKGYAEIGPKTIGEEVKTTSVGHVFGAGKGILPGGDYAFVQGTTKRMVAVRDSEGHITGNTWDYFAAGEADYITFVKTLALASQTNVTIDGNAKVKGSVFGGSESGFVQFDTNVNVLGGTIGTQGKGGADFGNVYGGGKGDVEYTGVNHDYITAGIVKGNTKVAISQAEGKTTKILHNVYGGGAYGTVGEFEYDATTGMPTARKTYTIGSDVHSTTGGKAEIYITGGIIGTDGNENGMIFGSSRGDVGAPGSIHDKAAWVYDTHVAIGDTTATTTTIATPLIKGSVYGGGENGHNFHSSYVRINGGTIGIPEGEPIGSYTAGGASYPYRGNVYGGGCGTDMYDTDNDSKGDTYNPLAGIVRGDATIRMTAGTVAHNMYGAGAMGSVGTTDGATSGKTTIDITGGTIGVSGTVGDGNVFGAARGDKEVTEIGLAQVRETRVTVSSGQVMGNVYGGGEVGNVGRFTNQDPVSVGNYNWDTSNAGSGLCTVTINGGKIGPDDVALSKEHGNVFGGGKGVSNTFECEKAMVYKTNVTISNGSTVNGTVYGGGEVGRVENNTVVTIGTENGTDEPEIKGSVFAAGAGTKTHGYSALVRGTSSVTVQGKAKVLKNVYGGGEEASVGRYKVKTPANKDDDDVPESLPYGMPAVLLNGGTSTVVIRDQAVIGTDNIATAGHVYGAGQGVDPHEVAYTYQSDETKPSRMVSGNTWEYFASEAAYLQFVETLALTGRTDVTIDEGATVKGSVFGGSESGFVYHDTDVKIKNGTIKGDAFGGGRGLATFAEAGRVSGNTEIAVSGGVVEGNVYGGGNLGDVGTINKTAQTNYNYIWKNSDCNGNVNATGNNNVAENNKITGTNKNTGICKVTISGGTIGVENPDDVTKHGNVFGAGEGLANTWWCEKAIAYATNVNITKGMVYGNVYGGGQIGRVEDDAKVTIGDPSVTDALTITGSVFGAGAGLATHGYSALVRGNADVTVQGKAQIGGSVYGGGETASVGKFTVVGGLPKHPDSGGICTVVIKDNAAITGEVFGACKGVDPSIIAAADRKSMQLATNAPEEASLWSYYEPDHTFIWRTYKTDADYLAFLETLALTSNTDVTIDGSATINESVYGGGQRGITLGSVKVDVIGGIVNKDVYGGGALANTNKGNWDDDKGTWADGKTSADYTTTVNLLGGIVHDVYGGGLGDSNTPAIVYGDVKVNLNGLETDNYVEALHKTLVSDLDESPDNTYYLANDGCIVTGNVFGCNNINGTPKGHAKVHVFKTLAKTGQAADGYDVAAVYGGGNAADYVPDASESAQSTEVIIEGCDKTSIENVYGGGYGAATPGTKVLIRGTKIINNVFGGGYGAGENNPGANVGYKTGGTTSYGKSDGGKAIVQLMAGKVNNIYGGSNTKGDIRGGSSVTNVAKDGGPGCCDNLMVREVYGGGNEADMYGGAEIVLRCMPDDWIEEIYAGAKNADVENDVSLTLTSGKFGRVFGGNKSGGKIDGSITLNIEESEDCEAPLIIGELYGGGNEAAYSAYGYGTDGTPLTEAQARDAYTGEGEYPGGFSGPWVNVKSFTSIGNIYGGGKGQSATLIGNPRVLINEVLVEGNNNVAYNPDNDTDKPAWIDGVKVKLYPHEAGKMGVIGNVFGGGNAADVKGNTSIEIGTGDSRYNTDSQAKVWFESTFETKNVVGADIRGNVYGGGNEAQVTGNTNVVVGKEAPAQ